MPRNILLYLLFSLFGFFLGSIMFSLILPRHFKGVDVRQLSDDGNPGTANAVKYGGVAIGMLCLAGDSSKSRAARLSRPQILRHATPAFCARHGKPSVGPRLLSLPWREGRKGHRARLWCAGRSASRGPFLCRSGSFLCVLFSGCCHRSKSPEGHRGFSCPASLQPAAQPQSGSCPWRNSAFGHCNRKTLAPSSLRRGKRVPFWQAETRAALSTIERRNHVKQQTTNRGFGRISGATI